MKNLIEIKQVSLTQVSLLQQLAITTFQQTFGFDNTPQQLQDFFVQNYNIDILTKELTQPESKTYFIYFNNAIVGFLKLNWGKAQTEQCFSNNSMEIQRIYLLQSYQGSGIGKYLFEFALKQAKLSKVEWIWLGVWEKNNKALAFYKKYGFEPFSQHKFIVGNKVDIDLLLGKQLSNNDTTPKFKLL